MAISNKESVISAVERILDNYLEMNNHRKTLERYTILRAVYGIHGHFTLEDLSAKLINEMNFHVSRATLYNTLNYEACYDNNSHCHQICTMCGKVMEVKSPEIIAAVENMPTKRFRKDGFTLYVYGMCSTCQARVTKRKKHEKTVKTKP